MKEINVSSELKSKRRDSRIFGDKEVVSKIEDDEDTTQPNDVNVGYIGICVSVQQCICVSREQRIIIINNNNEVFGVLVFGV